MPKETRKYKNRAAYMVQAVAKRRRKIKLMSIQYKGGKCQICGYNQYPGALDFHHVVHNIHSPNFSIGNKGYTRSWKRVKTELDKCILVCSNCHREIHGGLIELPESATL